MSQPANPTRRNFFRKSGAIAGAAFVTATTVSTLNAHSAWAREPEKRRRAGKTYGPVTPTPDQNGQMVLALPAGFSYVTFSRIGDTMGDGTLVPVALDGMAAFKGPSGTVRLIRNHEVRSAPGTAAGAVGGPSATKYDPLGVGGCSIIDFDPRRKRSVREFIALNGTIVNCAGGYAYKDAGWITCEETVAGPAQGWGKKHGYSFLVPAGADTAVSAVALTALGRFSKEAAVADEDGIVYQTEDAGSGVGSGFYRFLPNDRRDLTKGGKLQMLGVKGAPQIDLRDSSLAGQVLEPGVKFEVKWIDIADPDPDLESGAPRVFQQAFDAGAAKFNRLEGVYRGEGESIYFVSTSGGDVKNGDRNSDGFAEGYGQVWQYIPGEDRRSPDALRLIYVSTDGALLDSPDNITVSPSGGILFCEDDASGGNTHYSGGDLSELAPGITDINRLVGLGRHGEPFVFAINILNDSEFAGATFSPDGDILFVNIFGDGTPGSGMTCAIAGPWRAGPL